jgi:hypothetical protein
MFGLRATVAQCGSRRRLARLGTASHISAMSTIAPAKPFVRRSVGAVVLPADQFEAWYRLASARPGLSDVERGVLTAIRDGFRQVEEQGYGPRLSYDRMAHRLDTGPIDVRWAVSRLVELGLVGVERGHGGRPNEYRMTLPRRLVASLVPTAVAEDAPI